MLATIREMGIEIEEARAFLREKCYISTILLEDVRLYTQYRPGRAVLALGHTIPH